MPWSRAKQIYDEMTAATEANDRMNPERLEKQLAAEHAGCMQGVNAYEAAKARGERRVPGGVHVSSPGDAQPGWMRGAGEDE